MTWQIQKEQFYEIRDEYARIEKPIYKNVNLEDIRAKYNLLLTFKEAMKGDVSFANLVNSMSQVLKKLDVEKILSEQSRDTIWSNYSERGMNKVIRPYIKGRGKNGIYPIEWVYKDTYKCSLSNGYWGVNNFKVMDVLGYVLLMKVGGDRLPEKRDPIFGDHKSIEDREIELNSARISLGDDLKDSIPEITSDYSITIDDRYFKKYSGLNLSSKDIHDLLLDTSRVEFKLHFPVILKENNGKESVHKMNYYSRFFELGYENVKVRKDGIVQERRYRINFTTMLGELFVNNLMSGYNNRVDLRFYLLPDGAQLFYRKFLLHQNGTYLQISKTKIADSCGYTDGNNSNLLKTIEANVLAPLVDSKLITSYKLADGLTEKKYIIMRDDTCRRM